LELLPYRSLRVFRRSCTRSKSDQSSESTTIGWAISAAVVTHHPRHHPQIRSTEAADHR